MFTEKDVSLINKKLRQDGIDFEVSLFDGGKSLNVERLEFGGCEDQDGALRSVLENYFRRDGRSVDLIKEKAVLREDRA